jgi:general secretion pathway protein L
MSTLIIILPDTAAPSVGAGTAAGPRQANGPSLNYLVTSDGVSVDRHSQADASLLSAVAHDEVVVVVPVRQLSWQIVQLPRGTLARNVIAQGDSSRLRNVLAGLIEEMVLDEPLDLHLALSPAAREIEPVTVAVCNRLWLKGWLQTLEMHHLTVARIVPEFAPAADAPLHVIGTSEQPWVVWSGIQPKLNGHSRSDAAIPSAAGLTVLPLTAATAELIGWEQGLDVSAEPAVAQIAEQLFARPVNLLQQNQRWLKALESPWDLAQFDLVNTRGSRGWRKLSKAVEVVLRTPRWRPARWALVALVLVQVLGLNAWAWIQHNRVLGHQQAMREILTQTFPSVKYVVDAPVQMRKELAALKQNNGSPASGDFDALLAALAKLPGAQESAAISAIEYSGQALQIKGLQLTGSQLQEGNVKLKALGVEASMRSDRLILQVKEP